MLDCDAHLLEGTLDVIKQQLHAHNLHTCGDALLPDMGLLQLIPHLHTQVFSVVLVISSGAAAGLIVKLCACRATMAVSFALPGVQTAGVWPQGVRMTW